MNVKTFQNSVDKLPYKKQKSNVAAGVRAGWNALSGVRPDVCDVLILLTDGHATLEETTIHSEVLHTYKNNITMFVVGLGKDLREMELLMLANNEPAHMYMSPTTDVLIELVNKVQQVACNCTPPPPPPPPPPECPRDVVFVLDGSSSVRAENWNKTLRFVKSFAAILPYDPEEILIGVVSFSDNATLEIPLGDNEIAASFNASVDKILYWDARTNTAAGLRVGRQALQSPRARDNALDVLILITDGQPNIKKEQTSVEVDENIKAGITTIVIGVGEFAPEDLRQLAGSTGDFLTSSDFSHLLEEVSHAHSMVCNLTVIECFFDVLLVLDRSITEDSNNWPTIMNFMKHVAPVTSSGQEEMHLGVITFGSTTSMDIPIGKMDPANMVLLNQYKNEKRNTVDGLRAGRLVFKNKMAGARPDVPSVLILITNGMPTSDEKQTLSELELIIEEGIITSVIGVGKQVSDFYKYGPKDVKVLSVDHLDELYTLVPSTYLSDIACDQKSTPSPDQQLPPPLLPGILESKMATGQPSDSAKDMSNACPHDVMFVLHDIAGRTDTFQEMVTVIQDFVSNVSLSTHRIGIIAKSATGDIRFYPTEMVEDEDFLSHLQTVTSIGPTVNPADSFTDGVAMLSLALDSGEPVPKVIVLLLPRGVRPGELDGLIAAARTAKQEGLTVYVLSDDTSREAVKAVASKPSLIFSLSHGSGIDTSSICLTHRPQAIGCDFEDDAGGPTLCNLMQMSDENEVGDTEFDWRLQSGPTPSQYTGPDSAVTGNFYIYIEASAPRTRGDKADIALPAVWWTGPSCLTFFYSMIGEHVGQLKVILKLTPPHPEQVVWEVTSEQSAEWLMGVVTLDITSQTQILLRGVVGEEYSGDIALDHVRLSPQACVPSSAQFIGHSLP